MNWDEAARQYWELVNRAPLASTDQVRKLIGNAASHLPKDNPCDLRWFVEALQGHPEKWFVAKVMEVARPIPQTLIDPLLRAALLEPNPSATKKFVDPCVREIGRENVLARARALTIGKGVQERDRLNNVEYWLGGANA